MSKTRNLSDLLDANGDVKTEALDNATLTGIDDNADAVAITIDSSENVLVKKTSVAYQTVGHELKSDGRAFHTADGGKAMSLVRKNSDGSILDFYIDGTEEGSIQVAGGGTLALGAGNTFLRFQNSDNTIRPTSNSGFSNRDNAIDLGASNARWKDLYLGGNIYLGGTGTANALDDFEEGTWTPTLTFANSASGSLNYTQRQGIYTKVGRLVHIQVFVAWNANNFTASNGAFELQGLPFVNHNTSNYRGGASIVYASGAWSGLTIYQQALRAENTASKFRFNYSPNTNGVISTEVGSYTNIGSNGSFMISGTYQTN